MHKLLGKYISKILKPIIIYAVCLGCSGIAIGQNTHTKDTTKALISYNKTAGSQITNDTIERHTEEAPLDIGKNRGLFILSPDHLMQMRILGSVRGLFTYTDQELKNDLSFNPYETPTNNSPITPNFYAGLTETRLGFEVTRRTKKMGDVFIRIEADFANSVNSFRIRHAYGMSKRFLIGQTWSLFSNISTNPPIVSFSGQVGTISIRTPQIRYFRHINHKMSWYVGLEYSTPDFFIPDSVKVTLLQVIPDFTARIDYISDVLHLQFSGIITSVSSRDSSNNISYAFGFGGSLSGKFTFIEKNRIHFSISSGNAISHFLAIFGGKQEDAAYNSATQKIEGLVSTSGFLAYGRELPFDISANISLGMAAITNKVYQPDNAYSYSYSAMLNVFWQPADGARLGLEYAYGKRVDKGGNNGNANRLSMLLYYDF